jgi:hypothetical protein
VAFPPLQFRCPPRHCGAARGKLSSEYTRAEFPHNSSKTLIRLQPVVFAGLLTPDYSVVNFANPAMLQQVIKCKK